MGTQKNCLNETPKHMLKMMGKKIFTNFAELFCLSKPVFKTTAFFMIVYALYKVKDVPKFIYLSYKKEASWKEYHICTFLSLIDIEQNILRTKQTWKLTYIL